ncbi:hypothetical protein BC829DRAFT_394748 [Chytridium lagenaria]|nr:hypothetical protein BC829DRAFT_394748 [Chytridium lagenaria]
MDKLVNSLMTLTGCKPIVRAGQKLILAPELENIDVQQLDIVHRLHYEVLMAVQGVIEKGEGCSQVRIQKGNRRVKVLSFSMVDPKKGPIFPVKARTPSFEQRMIALEEEQEMAEEEARYNDMLNHDSDNEHRFSMSPNSLTSSSTADLDPTTSPEDSSISTQNSKPLVVDPTTSCKIIEQNVGSGTAPPIIAYKQRVNSFLENAQIPVKSVMTPSSTNAFLEIAKKNIAEPVPNASRSSHSSIVAYKQHRMNSSPSSTIACSPTIPERIIAKRSLASDRVVRSFGCNAVASQTSSVFEFLKNESDITKGKRRRDDEVEVDAEIKSMHVKRKRNVVEVLKKDGDETRSTIRRRIF